MTRLAISNPVPYANRVEGGFHGPRPRIRIALPPPVTPELLLATWAAMSFFAALGLWLLTVLG